jgi:hypothetical protein
MKDGTFTYFTVQHRTTHKNDWLKPKSLLKPVKEKDEWSFSSFDHFGPSFNPHIGTGNDWRAEDKKASDEIYNVWCNTSHHGWWSLKYAILALCRVRKDDANGEYDTRDTYRHYCQSVRHEYRIVKLTVSKQTEVVSCEDLMDALVA